MGDRELVIPNGPGTMARIPDAYSKDIVLSFKIEADSSRVLYALSLPEYIEAWLQAPDAEELRVVFNLETKEAFRIDLYRAETLKASVHGSCRVISANHIRYVWKTTSPVGTTETLVDMNILCGSGGCILGLKHSGFKDAIESAWCCKMWHQSLSRLCRLVEKN